MTWSFQLGSPASGEDAFRARRRKPAIVAEEVLYITEHSVVPL